MSKPAPDRPDPTEIEVVECAGPEQITDDVDVERA
jgi:hypothetical protein